jgi:DNA-binding CsgD family transcriptional regulator
MILSTDLPQPTRLRRTVRARWTLVAAHLAAALRLRRSLGEEPDAILAPGGRVVHAARDATPALARDRLREAVLLRDRARTRKTRKEPDRALAMWTGLVCGRWSLVDRFERDGRRYVVARRNTPDPASPLALSLRERQVLGHLMQGDSLKMTVYALGLSPATVSEAARTAMLKLGVRSVAELVGVRLASGALPPDSR